MREITVEKSRAWADFVKARRRKNKKLKSKPMPPQPLGYKVKPSHLIQVVPNGYIEVRTATEVKHLHISCRLYKIVENVLPSDLPSAVIRNFYATKTEVYTYDQSSRSWSMKIANEGLY